jgi:hypothetical protein
MSRSAGWKSTGGWTAGVLAVLLALAMPAARGGLFDEDGAEARMREASQQPTHAAAAPVPQPVPNAFQIAGVEKLLRQIYGPKLDVKSPAELDELARTLFGQCGQSDDPAEHWVLLREARDRAARAGDAALAFDAVAGAIERFDFDPHDVIEGALAALSAGERPLPQAAADELQFGRRCFALGKFALAVKAFGTAQGVARACRDQPLAAQLAVAAPPASEALEAANRAKAAAELLKSRPHDPASCEQIGRYECFTLGHWPPGLAMLSKAGNEPLQLLALKELENNATPNGRLALADEWLKAAKTDRQNPDGCRRRAEYWYRLVIEQLDGLPRLSAQKRLQQIAADHLERGVVCELFNGRFFERRLLTRIDPQINFPWNGQSPAPGVPPECFSARLTGWIKFPASGEYKIVVRHDDGARLWIDGVRAIDNWQIGSRENSAAVTLSAGLHELRLEFMQGGGPSGLVMLWTTPSEQAITPIAAEAFFHEPLDTPQQLQSLIEPDANGALHLTAALADVHGDGGRYIDIDGASPAISGLQNPAAYASWDVDVPEGTYLVDLTTSCDANSGGEYLVTVGPAGFRGTSQNTGGWDHPAEQSLGAVKLSAGSHRITVRSTSAPRGRAFQVNQITLRSKK